MPKPCNFIKKETLAQVFSVEFCEISKNTYGRLLLRNNSDDEEESAEYKVKRISNSEWCKTSLWQMFFKLGVRPATLLKRDFNTGVFL